MIEKKDIFEQLNIYGLFMSTYDDLSMIATCKTPGIYRFHLVYDLTEAERWAIVNASAMDTLRDRQVLDFIVNHTVSYVKDCSALYFIEGNTYWIRDFEATVSQRACQVCDGYYLLDREQVLPTLFSLLGRSVKTQTY